MRNAKYFFSTSISKSLTLLLLSAITLTGCSSLGLNFPSYTKNGTSNGVLYGRSGVYPQPESALDIISQESQRALNAQKALVKFREQYNASLDYRQKSFDQDQILVDYIGKPPALLSSIAIRYGYRYLEVGQSRELPTINFTSNWTTPENAILNTSAQLGESATISLDKNSKVITLIYK